MIAPPAVAQFERPPEPKTDAPVADDAARAQLVMPKLVQFVSATYPPDAQKAGLQADVVLRLTIDETGKVTEAEVVEPVGHGFDEAARAAAMQFTFEPGRRNGVAIKALIKYKYSFTLTPVEPAKTAAPPPSIGNLGGEVRIAGAEVPLAGVELDISGPDSFNDRRATDALGRWHLEGVKPGRYKITAVAKGFAAFQSEEEVVAGDETEVTYRLVEATDELEVTVTGERPPREVTRHTIERREMERIPGTSGDALRSIENLPGVARPPGLAGLLIIRGSAPEDTQVFVDGSNIPIIYHFGGLRSVFPSELLDRIDFYPGNFSAQYGRAMGGIIDVALRAPDTSCKGPYGQPTDKTGCFNGIASVDLIEGRALLQGPLPVKGWSFAAGVRRSWVDAWLGPVLSSAGANIRTLPVYYDWQFIVENKPTRDSRLSLRFFGSDDRFAAVIDPLAQEPGFGGDLSFSQTNWTAQGLYEGQITRNLSERVMASVSRATFRFGLGGTFDFNIITHPIQYRHEFGWKLAPGIKLNAGIDTQVIPYDVSIISPPPPQPGQADAGPFTNEEPLSVTATRSIIEEAVYVDAELQPTNRWRIVPGFRLDYSSDTRTTDPNPRINTRYDLVQGGTLADGSLKRRTTIKGGVGEYTQPPQTYQTNSVFGTPGIVANRSVHYSVGVEQEFTREIDVSLEGFYKDLTRQVAPSADPNGPRYTNLGTGYVIGLETLIKYKPSKRFFGWIAYTLSRSVRRDYPGGVEYRFQYDQTHNLTALGSYRLGRGWEFGARFRLISRQPGNPGDSTPESSCHLRRRCGLVRPATGSALHRTPSTVPCFGCARGQALAIQELAIGRVPGCLQRVQQPQPRGAILRLSLCAAELSKWTAISAQHRRTR